MNKNEEHKDETVEERMERYLKWQNKYPFKLTNDEQKVLNKLQKAKDISKQSDKESSEEEFGNYYEDYEFEDPVRDGVLVC